MSCAQHNGLGSFAMMRAMAAARRAWGYTDAAAGAPAAMWSHANPLTRSCLLEPEGQLVLCCPRGMTRRLLF